MQGVFITGVLILVVIESVSSLQCYHCHSYDSFDDCDKNRELAYCENEKMHKCSKITYELPHTKVYRKGCIDLAYCKDTDRYCAQVTNSDSDDCDVLCCKDDKCNAGSKISSGMVYACVIMNLFLRCFL